MSKLAAQDVTGYAVCVRDESYGPFERDGQKVERVERRALTISLGWDVGVIADLMLTHPVDIGIADCLDAEDPVTARVIATGRTDQWGKVYMEYKRAAGDDPVLVGEYRN